MKAKALHKIEGLILCTPKLKFRVIFCEEWNRSFVVQERKEISLYGNENGISLYGKTFTTTATAAGIGVIEEETLTIQSITEFQFGIYQV